MTLHRNEASVRFCLLDQSLYVPTLGIVSNTSDGDNEREDEEEEDVQICGYCSAGVRIRGGATVEAAASSWAFTVGRGPRAVAVAMSKAVAHPVPVAVVWAGERTYLQVSHGHALLVDTQAVFTAPCTLWGKPWVHIINSKVDQSCPAGDDLSPAVDEGVREDGNRFHPKLKAFIQVLAV